MNSLRFTACTGLVTIDVEVDVDDMLNLDKNLRDQIFATVDDLHGMFDEFVDPAVRSPRKKRAAAVVKEKAKKPARPPAPEVDRPKIGDARPAPDLKQITKRLKGDGAIRWDAQIATLFDGTCDRIVREVDNEKAGSNLKYFVQNKDRRVRVDVETIEGVTIVQVRRRADDE